MAGWSPASLIVASFLLLQLSGKLQLIDACSVFCPEGEHPCSCPSGRPDPTPDPITGIIITDSCGNRIHYCSVGGECKPEDNGCPANCPQICTLDYSPVCGTDTKTYSNKCALEVAACKTRNQDLVIAYQGECTECKAFCTFEYAPVCGTDGATYSSECSLKSKACRERSNLKIAYSGECDKKCKPFCTFDYSPVCGTDGQTHSNECALTSKACRERSGLTVAHKGECGSSSPLIELTPLGPGALPPAWTQVENTDECLKEYKPTSPIDALHFEVCVPLLKPTECSQPTWWELATVLDAVPKEELVSAKPPLYLEIEGVRDCLDSYQFDESSHTESCLPLKRPKDFCNPDSWDRLVHVWDGIKCPKDNIQLLGEDRVRPDYLSVPGWRKCLFGYQSGTFRSSCMPSYKPQLCTHNSWSQLKTKFKGAKCSLKPRIIASAKIIAPPYLSIEGHEKCLDTHSNGQYTVKCLPGTKPSQCSTAIWDRVKDSFNGLPCPSQSNLLGVGLVRPAYLGVNGFQQCLGSFEASSSHTEVCLPLSRPTNCKAESWKKLKHEGIFKGVKCPLTGRPPVYLSIDGYKKCLSTYQASLTHKGLCIPVAKPRRCRETAWQQLQVYYHGVKCPAQEIPLIGGVGAPEYLSIAGHENCLGENQEDGFTSSCIPAVKPSNCEDDAFNKLAQVSDAPPACKPKPLLTGIPPAYLSIDGHEHCLGELTSGGHKEVCLPRVKPFNCTVEAWLGLQHKFKGQDCNPLLRGVRILPPQYLSVVGHAECLSQQKSAPNGHIEKCLPNSRPENCIPPAWKALTEDGKFGGRKCRSVQIIGIPAPMYTQVPGYDKCLGSKQSLSGMHQEVCLPSTKPSACTVDAWNKLQQDFVGTDCNNQQTPLIGRPSSHNVPLLGEQAIGLPPKYLSIVGHRNCLGSHSPIGASHTEICLPSVKPASCNTNAWGELKKEAAVGGINECQPKVLLGGGLRALPPKYLSIEGHQECLSKHSPRGASHTEICLPGVKPASCDSNAWNELKKEVTARRINKCPPKVLLGGGLGALPPKYLSIDGHQDCLSDHSPRGASHMEICLPGVKPASCDSNAWNELKKEVAARRINKCPPKVLLGGGLRALPPKYLSIGGHQDCLSDHSPRVGASHTEICLPSSKPVSCSSVAWDKLKEEVSARRIDKCRSSIQSLGGESGLPPSYLGIDGHGKCLSSHSSMPGGGHSEVCIPKSIPLDCTREAWQKLETERGQGNLNQCRMPIIGFPIKPILGGGLQALPPKYLQVNGWRDCTRSFEASDSHSENCLPLNKPALPCTPQAYKELMQIAFEVEVTRAATLPGILDAQPPEYLYVDGHEKCLDDINVGNHKERCLPSNRPHGCDSSTWIQLQNVFDGKPCKACQKFCTLDFAPVCGSDDVTYSNKCALEYTACKEDKLLSIKKHGKCCPFACTFDSSPVCGTDGITYPNPCALEKEVCTNNDGLKLAYDGECKTATTGTKQEGEECGSCFSPQNNFFCGKCVSGLECVPDSRADILPDLPARCRKKPERFQQEGDDCGDCGPDLYCGTCARGLECERNRLLPDAPGKCIRVLLEPPMPPLPPIPPLRLVAAEGEGCGGEEGPICGDGLQCIGKVQEIDGLGTCRREATNCPTGVNVVNCLLDPCNGATCASNPEEATCVSNYCGGCNAVFYDYDGENVLTCIKPPDRKLGEDCGSCFCPPTYTMGDCAPGLECKHNPMIPDAAGICVKPEQFARNNDCYGNCIESGKDGRECADKCREPVVTEQYADCYGNCIESGKDGRECADKCRGPVLFEPEPSPFAAVTECQPENDDCPFEYNGKKAFCHQVLTLGVPGICVPRRQFCETSSDCLKVGNVHTGGQYGARCNSFELCEYHPVATLA